MNTAVEWIRADDAFSRLLTVDLIPDLTNSRLAAALIECQVPARGMGKSEAVEVIPSYFWAVADDMTDLMALAFDINFETCEVTRLKSRIDPEKGRVPPYEIDQYKELEISWRHMQQVFALSSAQIVPISSQGTATTGRKREIDWEALLIEAARIQYSEGLPQAQSTLVTRLQEWYALRNAGREPGLTETKKRVSALYRAIHSDD